MQACMQAGGGLLFQGDNNGSYLTLNESVVHSNYVDSSFTGSTSSGLGGVGLIDMSLSLVIRICQNVDHISYGHLPASTPAWWELLSRCSLSLYCGWPVSGASSA